MRPVSPCPLAALLAAGLAAAALAGGAPSHASPPPVEPDLWVMSSDGTGQRVLAENAHHGSVGTWSPDGTRIAYGGRAGIYVVSADGDSPALLIAPGFSPAWSPDGTQIAYVLVDEAGAHLRVMAPDGSNQRTLTDIAGYLVGLAWSPDGSTLAFIRGEGSARPQLEVVGADGSGRRVLATVGSGRPSWSPDGSELTVVGAGGEVVAVDATTGARRVVATTGAFADVPVWSARDEIAYGDEAHIYVVNADASGRALVGRGHSPEWSPDGSRMVFWFEGDLWLTEPGEPGAPNLTHSSDYESQPRWSPDGSKIAFLREPVAQTRVHERAVSASLGGGRVTGKVTVADGYSLCRYRTRVTLQRLRTGGWRSIDKKKKTSRRGAFSWRPPDRPGFYRVKAPLGGDGQPWGTDMCAAAVSPPLRYRG